MTLSIDTLIFWLFVGAWAIVIGMIAFVQVPRIVGEVQRLIKHVNRLIDDSPLPLQIAKAESDLARIEAAGERLPALQSRADAALTAIREAPLVPPELTQLGQRVRFEIAAFRAAR